MTPGRVKKLFKAIEAGATSTVTALLNEEPEAIEVPGQHNRYCRDKTPLMYALQCHCFGIAEELLRRGANVNARMAGGPRSSVISLAVRFVIAGRDNRDMLAFVERLIDAGADPTDALWPACHVYDKRSDRSEFIELLLERGADPDRQVGDSGSSARDLIRINAKLYSPRVLRLFDVEDDAG